MFAKSLEKQKIPRPERQKTCSKPSKHNAFNSLRSKIVQKIAKSSVFRGELQKEPNKASHCKRNAVPASIFERLFLLLLVLLLLLLVLLLRLVLLLQLLVLLLLLLLVRLLLLLLLLLLVLLLLVLLLVLLLLLVVLLLLLLVLLLVLLLLLLLVLLLSSSTGWKLLRITIWCSGV